MRILVFPLLLLLLGGGGEGGERSRDPDPEVRNPVRINILSKHLRLIREEGEGSLTFNSEIPLPVYDLVAGKTYQAQSLIISCEKGSWKIGTEAGEDSGRFNILVKKTGNSSTVKIRIKNELRSYPLPLSVKWGRIYPRITVTEDIRRYSLDSAVAEYGARSSREYEALDALARVIEARSLISLKSPRHQGSHFCDLTHCQVYRGRSGIKRAGRLPFAGRWEIDLKNLKNPLLFHSSCGGRTFGPELFTAEPSYKYSGVRDILYRENLLLCRKGNSHWERKLDTAEITGILKLKGCSSPGRGTFFEYDRKKPEVRIDCGGRGVNLPPETFRLRINRVKGWNFLRSNNYTLEREREPGQVLVKGFGLGHGSGFCQTGALELSRRGYSAAEILRHYYPDVELVSLTGEDDRSFNLSYALFDLASGRLTGSSSPALVRRRFPPGSLWKLVTSLYLAGKRQDLLKDYRYHCTGKRGDDPRLPERCWKRGGHGSIGFRSALSGSCNLYFASLYRVIDFRDYREFVRGLFRDLNIDVVIPETGKRGDEAEILAGLDFRISLGIADLIKIAALFQPVEPVNKRVRNIRNSIPLWGRNAILEALYGTFIKGTAAFHREGEKPVAMKNSLIFSRENALLLNNKNDGLWGKTSTVIDGTNKPVSYGIFLGALETKGIILFLKNSNGHNAAKWGKILLLNR